MNAFLNFLAALCGRLQRPSAGITAPSLGYALKHETQSLPETLARIAESQVGVHEEGGSNTGVQVQAYQSATWLAGTGWKWCAAFVCWCVWQTLQALGLDPSTEGWSRPRTAGAFDFQNWARGTKPHGPNRRWHVLTPSRIQHPRRGDIIVYDWSHIGIVTAYDQASGKSTVVEGNQGNQVAKIRRPMNMGVRCLIRYSVG